MFFFKRKKNRKWQERPVLYRGRFFYIRQVAQVALVLSILAVAVATTVYFRNSSALFVKHVAVTGSVKHMTQDEVVALSEIKENDTLFLVSLRHVQQNILRNPWAREVRVRREFPDTIQVQIVEQEPVALLNVGTLYLVNEQGVVFKKADETDPKDLPVISGYDKEELAEFPILMRRSLREALDFLKYLNDQNYFIQEPISEIVVDMAFGYTVYTKNKATEIYYGTGDYQKKQKLLEKFKLSDIFKRQSFARLDLGSPQRIIARRM